MRAPTTRRVRVAAVAAVGALAVSACSFHPGQAAVVNDSPISQSRVDDTVLAACAFTKVQRVAQHGPTPTTSVAFLRNFFVGQFITFKITDKAASERGITVTPSAIHVITTGEAIPPSLSSSQRSLLEDFFDDSARSELQTALIGAQLKHKSITSYQVSKLSSTAAQVYINAGTAWLKTYTSQQDVSVNPAYGTWSKGTVLDTDGSLSSAVSGTARTWLSLRSANSSSVTGLPASQVCG